MNYSPYAPPGNTARQGGGFFIFESLGWKTTWTAVLIAVATFLGVLVLGLASLVGTPSDKNLAGVLLLGFITIASQLISLGASVLFLVWMHQASKNVHTFRRLGLDFTPGWCVGWWFIPFFSMWKPYQALKEIWLASDASSASAADDSWRTRRVPWTFPFWWATYLLSGFLALGGAAGSAIAAFQHASSSLSDGVLWVSMFLSAMATVAVISIIRQLDRRQEASAHALATAVQTHHA